MTSERRNITHPTKILEKSFLVPRVLIMSTGGIGDVSSLLNSPRHPRTQPTAPSPPAFYKPNTKSHFNS